MKKSELILSSFLLSLSLPLAGCEKNNDISNDAIPNTVVEEGSGQNNSDDSQERTIKLELFKKLEGSKVIPLSENRIFVVNDEHSTIYDENFNVVKDVGNVTISRSNVSDYRGMFKYKVPYFHDGEMQYKKGLMDFDGNILFEAQLFDSSLNEDETSPKEEEMYSLIRSEGGTTHITYDYTYMVGLRTTENGGIELARIQTYPDTSKEGDERIVKVLDVLLEGDYEALLYEGSSASLEGEYRIPEYEEKYHDINSVAFKKNGQWGVVGLDGNIILDPEYGKIVFSHHSSIDGLDYYKVTNESGKVGIFNTNGWVIEPTFSHADQVYMAGLNTVVDEKSKSGKTKVYNKEGKLLKEFDFRASVTPLTNYSNDDVASDEFFQVSEIGDNKGQVLFDSNFNEITLPEEIPNNHNSFNFLNDEVILVRNSPDYYLIDTKGNLIAKLKSEDSEKIHWINDKYLIDNKSVYELISE